MSANKVMWPSECIVKWDLLVLSISTPPLSFSFWRFLLHIKLSDMVNSDFHLSVKLPASLFSALEYLWGPVKQRCICCQRDEDVAARVERAVLSEEWGEGRRVVDEGKKRVPLSGSEIPAGLLTCQLLRLRCPAGTIMGLCVLAVLPLTDYSNAIIDVQMGS